MGEVMTENKFTPGPWEKVRGELVGSNGKKVVEFGSGVAIMCGGGENPEHVANAVLRNAAPELYEALKLARDHMVSEGSAIAEICDAALAKASPDKSGGA